VTTEAVLTPRVGTKMSGSADPAPWLDGVGGLDGVSAEARGCGCGLGQDPLVFGDRIRAADCSLPIRQMFYRLGCPYITGIYGTAYFLRMGSGHSLRSRRAPWQLAPTPREEWLYLLARCSDGDRTEWRLQMIDTE